MSSSALSEAISFLDPNGIDTTSSLGEPSLTGVVRRAWMVAGTGDMAVDWDDVGCVSVGGGKAAEAGSTRAPRGAELASGGPPVPPRAICSRHDSWMTIHELPPDPKNIVKCVS